MQYDAPRPGCQHPRPSFFSSVPAASGCPFAPAASCTAPRAAPVPQASTSGVRSRRSAPGSPRSGPPVVLVMVAAPWVHSRRRDAGHGAAGASRARYGTAQGTIQPAPGRAGAPLAGRFGPSRSFPTAVPTSRCRSIGGFGPLRPRCVPPGSAQWPRTPPSARPAAAIRPRQRLCRPLLASIGGSPRSDRQPFPPRSAPDRPAPGAVTGLTARSGARSALARPSRRPPSASARRPPARWRAASRLPAAAHRPLGSRTPAPRPPAQFPTAPMNARNPPRLHPHRIQGVRKKSGMREPTGAALDYATLHVAILM